MLKKTRSSDVQVPPGPMLPPGPALPDEAPRRPVPAATEGTFYSMLDILQRQDDQAGLADPTNTDRH